MAFSSPRYFVFLALVLLALWLVPGLRSRKVLLVLASCGFYAAWDYRYLPLLLLVSGIDYWCAARIDASPAPRARRGWLLLSLASNLGILAWFKYGGLFLPGLNGALAGWGWVIPGLAAALPIGLSFYTLKSLSYTIDVYRGQLRPCRSQLDYTMFVSFFPELIAGPIVRGRVFLPQTRREIGPSRERLRLGASIFLLGLTKKLLCADNLALAADPVFAAPQAFSTASLWLAALAYAGQVYCDFSGYSDMAIGTAKMIGYDLPRNFRLPYLGADIADMWRRWHITLTSWLRDYVYLSLGGDHRSELRTSLNLLITMVLCGLWHRGSWNLLLWGGLHGTALAVHQAVARRLGRPLPVWLSWPLTMGYMLLSWVPFRASDLGDTLLMWRAMLGGGAGPAAWYPAALAWLVPLLAAAHAAGYWLDRHWERGETAAANRWLAPWDAELRGDPISGWAVRLGAGTGPGAFLLTAWVLALLYFSPLQYNPFIYFQF